MTRSVVVSINGGNRYSNAVDADAGKLSLVLRGTWVATVHLQRSDDGGVTWDDVAAFVTNGVYVIEEALSDVTYRVGVKTGNHASGTVQGSPAQEYSA
jgi:hypothetical protein